jgi:uncharacterized protein (TIGR03067 family)
MSVALHPELERLTSFAQGRLEDVEIDAIEGHLAQCASCCATIRQIQEDGFMGAVRACRAAGDTPGGTTATKHDDELPRELVQHPRYRVERLLGAGGMGRVYKAEHLVMERTVALKVINRDLTDRPEVVERFRREVKAAARLVHPNIVLAHDAEQAGTSHFLVMEYVAGTTLARLVAERGALPVRLACEFMRQAALGLEYARELGMVHRDVKPQNLMVVDTKDGPIVKILDFGLARVASAVRLEATASTAEAAVGTAAMTNAGMVLGTADYIAPEQVEDPHSADIRADIYGLGCTFYFVLTGQPPFVEESVVQTLQAQRERTPPPIGKLRPDVPGGLGPILTRMLAKDPAERFQTPAEVAQALSALLEDDKPSVRRRWPWVALGAGLLLTAGIAAYITRDAAPASAPIPEPTAQARPDDGVPGELLVIDTGLGPSTCVALSADSTRILSGSSRGIVSLWDARTGRAVQRFEGHTRPVCGVAFTRDGATAVSAGEDETVRVWDTAVGTQERVIAWRSEPLQCLALAPDGRHILAGSRQGNLRLWERATGRVLWMRGGHTGPVHCVAFGPDGKLALSTDGAVEGGRTSGTIRLWEVDSGKELRVLAGHSRHVGAAAFSPDGKTVLSGSRDGTLRLWDAATGTEQRRITTTLWTESVAWSPDGQRALTGGRDPAVRLWDLRAGTLLYRCLGHTDAAISVAFDAGGRRGVSSSWDGAIRLWRLPEPDHGNQPSSDQVLIQGTWLVTATEVLGQPLPPDIVDTVKPTLTFAGDRMAVGPRAALQIAKQMLDAASDGGLLPGDVAALVEDRLEATFHLDATRGLATIDVLTVGRVRKTALGVYALDGDNLKLCLALDPSRADDRPREFSSKGIIPRVLLTLKRQQSTDK